MVASLSRVGDWAGQLAEVADHVTSQLPVGEEWSALRGIINNIGGMLRKGDYRAGIKAVYKILPYVQRCLSSVEKTACLSSTQEITESVCQHFLVEEEAREEINAFIKLTSGRMDKLRQKVEQFAASLDAALSASVDGTSSLGVLPSLQLAFNMNRIQAMIRSVEYDIKQARHMLDELDTHVAGKSLLASLLATVSFLTGIAFSASGNLPVSAACFTAATASRKSVTALGDYRSQLAKLDSEHRRLQRELSEWKHRFRAEQINFLLLFGLQRTLIFLGILAAVFFIIGRPANFVMFGLTTIYLVVRSEQCNSVKYYAGLGMAFLAMLLEYDEQHGLMLFNLFACVLVGLNSLGLIDM